MDCPPKKWPLRVEVADCIQSFFRNVMFLRFLMKKVFGNLKMNISNNNATVYLLTT